MSETNILCYNSTKNKIMIALALYLLKHKPSQLTCEQYLQQIRQSYFNLDNYTQLTQCFLEDYYTCTTPDNSQKINNIKENIPKDPQDGDVHKNKNQFTILQCLNNIKSYISTLNGSMSYNDIDIYNYSESIVPPQYNKNYEDLNKNLLKVISFICDSTQEDVSKTMLDYVSDVLGRTFDILHDRDISLSSFDKVTEEILDSIETLLLSENQILTENMYEYKTINKIMKLTKATMFVNFTLGELLNRLLRFTNHIKNCRSSTPLEYEDIDGVEKSFYIFHLLEILIRRKKTTEKPSTLNTDISNADDWEETGPSKFNISQVWRSNWITSQVNKKDDILNNKTGSDDKLLDIKDILDKITIECVESYPLMSFWAMECLTAYD